MRTQAPRRVGLETYLCGDKMRSFARTHAFLFWSQRVSAALPGLASSLFVVCLWFVHAVFQVVKRYCPVFYSNLIPSYPQNILSSFGINIKRLHNAECYKNTGIQGIGDCAACYTCRLPLTRILQCKVFVTLYDNASRLRPPPPRPAPPHTHHLWPPFGKVPRGTMTR